MKKKFFAVALAMLTMGSYATISAANDDNTTVTEQTQKCCKDSKKECKDGKKECKGKMDKKGDRQGRDKKDCKQNPMLQGITLTAEQQAKLDALQQQRMQERKAAKQEKQAAKEQAKQDRMAQVNADMKEILTPEQYAQYEQNVASMKAKREAQQANKGNKDGKMKRDDRRGGKDMKAGRRPAAEQKVAE